MRRFFGTLLLPLALGATAEAEDDWFAASSDHFTIVSNGREGRAKELLEDLEQLRRLMSEVLPSQRVDGTKPGVFYVFKNEKSMRPFQPTRDGEQEEWAGMYRPTPFADVVLVLGEGSSEAARSLAFGQYVHLISSYNDANYPVWLSNGLSRFYANTEISNKQASIGKMRRGYRSVLGEFRSVPIRELFLVTRSSDYYRDLGKRDLFDAQCWAMVHYLLIGQLEENGPQRLSRYLRMLDDGQDPLIAFQEAMGKPLDEIDREVALYIRKRISTHLKVELPLKMEKNFTIVELDPAARDAHLGQLFMATHHNDEAEAMLASSIEADPDQVVAFEAMANLRERQRQFGDVSSFLARAVRNGSTNPRVHLRYAQLFVSTHEGVESELNDPAMASPVLESLRFVIGEAPELTDAARAFGFLALYHPEARQEAFQVVADALKRKPGEPSLVLMVGQLHVKERNYVAARTIFGRLLERRLDPELDAAVRQQYDFANHQVELAAAAAGTDGSAAMEPGDTEKDLEAASEIVEVRGKLVRFECTDGFRFIVVAGDDSYTLNVVDLAGLEIVENGERVARDFYCGPLDDAVAVGFIPGTTERSGRLVTIEFGLPVER